LGLDIQLHIGELGKSHDLAVKSDISSVADDAKQSEKEQYKRFSLEPYPPQYYLFHFQSFYPLSVIPRTAS
jgi:hypothetical protein